MVEPKIFSCIISVNTNSGTRMVAIRNYGYKKFNEK
jgi:hypothetical protein